MTRPALSERRGIDHSPAVLRTLSPMTRASSNPSARIRATRSSGGGESTESTISALPPSARARDGHVRDVHARLAEHRADPADHAGHVVVAEEHEQRRELDLEVEAERARRATGGCSLPIVVPATRDLLVAVPDLDAEEVRVVARRLRALLAHLDAALARDRRRVHVVHRTVGAALERAVQRRDRQQPRVVVGERRRTT